MPDPTPVAATSLHGEGGKGLAGLRPKIPGPQPAWGVVMIAGDLYTFSESQIPDISDLW